MKKIFFIILTLIYLVSLKSIDVTGALFTDTGTSSASFAAGYWNIPPSITNVSALIATLNDSNDVKATITWLTNENATGNLEFGTTSNGPYTLTFPEDITADNLSHTREISGLASETTYYYRVKSKNSYGYETVSAEYSFTTGGVRPAIPLAGDIVINEFLPNPAGADNAPMPGGEWVELYNRGSDTVDLTGWYLTDSDPNHILPITPAPLAPGGFMVVYRNGNANFALNNDAAGDEVNLYNNANVLIDQHIYNSGNGDTVLENKSFARYPDGSDTWFDPIPSPGRPNILESPEISPAYAVTVTDGDLQVTYDEPLFPNTIIWYPGLSITKSITVKNIGRVKHAVSVKATNTFQAGDIANHYYFKITEGAITRYSGANDKTMKNFWDAGEIILSDINSGNFTSYNISVTMPAVSGNDFQGKKAKFDLVISFISTSSQVTITGGGAVAGVATTIKPTGEVKGQQTSSRINLIIFFLLAGGAVGLIYFIYKKFKLSHTTSQD